METLPSISKYQGSGKLIDTMANVSISGGNFFHNVEIER